MPFRLRDRVNLTPRRLRPLVEAWLNLSGTFRAWKPSTWKAGVSLSVRVLKFATWNSRTDTFSANLPGPIDWRSK